MVVELVHAQSFRIFAYGLANANGLMAVEVVHAHRTRPWYLLRTGMLGEIASPVILGCLPDFCVSSMVSNVCNVF